MLVLRSTTSLQMWSLSEPAGLNGEDSLLFLCCLEHILESVHNMGMSELTEGSRCPLGVTLIPVVVALLGIQKVLIREKAIAVLFLIIKHGIHPGRKRSGLCLCLSY